jgi:hypothetical protein
LAFAIANERNVYVNLQTGVATDLAGFSNIQIVIGATVAATR